MKWKIFERQEEDMATKKVETKSRSANPRASAATTKATSKPTAKASKPTVKSTAKPAVKSTTAAKSTVTKSAPKAKAQPADKAKAQPVNQSKVQPAAKSKAQPATESKVQSAATKAKAQSSSKANAPVSSRNTPIAKTSRVLSKPQSTSTSGVAVKAEKPVITPKQSTPKKVIVSITFEQIAQRAYEMWEQRGYSHGNDVDDWCRAEAELLNK